jgi:peptidyl-prolyl cis-trans isomerase SurA
MKPTRSLGILVLAAGMASNAGAASSVVNGIRGIVHDSVITQQDVQEMTQPALSVLQRQYPGQTQAVLEKLAKAEQDNLRVLMDRQLILHDFNTAGYTLPESVLEDVVQERIRSRFGDQRTLTKTLQAEGITKEKFRERVREQFILEVMRQKHISAELIISPQKVENYYQAHKEEFKVEERVKMDMIVLNRNGDTNTANPQQLAQELLLKVKDGAPFTELASVYSQRAQRQAGGEWFAKSQLRPELAAAIANLKPGQASDVVETADAYYLVYVQEVEGNHFKPLNEVRPTIEATLLTEERARLEKQWVGRLRKKTFTREY